MLPPRETPVVELPKLAEDMELGKVTAKLEFESLTGSFKDRGTSVMIAVAVESGVDELVEDSSGNAGASVAAFSARTGIRAHVFAPAAAPAAKLKQIEVYGATVHAIDGTREETAQAAVDIYRTRGMVYASHALSPYFLEGTKTFAYELLRQSSGNIPDHIVFPVGNGSLLLGAWKGFAELREAGRISDIPKLHCVQTDAVRPIAAAFAGESWSSADAGETRAGGIAVASPARLQQIVRAVGEAGGTAVTVDEDSISKWQRSLAAREGIYAEPTSAAAFAGLASLVAGRAIGGGESVLVPVTGAGPKDRPA
jgi:threonine synthase